MRFSVRTVIVKVAGRVGVRPATEDGVGGEGFWKCTQKLRVGRARGIDRPHTPLSRRDLHSRLENQFKQPNVVAALGAVAEHKAPLLR